MNQGNGNENEYEILRDGDRLRQIYCDLFDNRAEGIIRTLTERETTQRQKVFKSFIILNKLIKYNKLNLWRNNEDIIFFHNNVDTKQYKTKYNYIIYYKDYNIYGLFFNNYLISFFDTREFNIFIFNPYNPTNNRRHKNLLNNIKTFKNILKNNILFLSLTYTEINNNFKLY